MKPTNAEIFNTLEDYSVLNMGYNGSIILNNADMTKFVCLLSKAEKINDNPYELSDKIKDKDFTLTFSVEPKNIQVIPISRNKYKQSKMAALLGLNQTENKDDK